jgi:hypothetical protein
MTESDDDNPRRFTTKTLLVATALFTLFFSFAIWLKSPLMFLTLTIFLVAGCVWRTTPVSRSGIAVWAIGSSLLTAFAYGAYVAPAEQEFRINVMLALVGAGMSMIAGTIFLIFACKRRPSRWQNVFCCVVSLLAPVIWGSIFHPIARDACLARIMQRDAAYARLVAEVNAVCVRLGRAPETEKELVKLLGKPLPQIVLTAGVTVPMRYNRLGAKHFRLSFVNSDGKVQVYDSQMPEHGWDEERL